MPYIPIIISLIALTISLSALTVATLNYRRKSSARVRGRFGISQSIYGEDDYVSSITLENMKDRPITILSIQLRVGYNYYLEIEAFEATPLIIRAFETWHAEYEPIDFYALSGRKIDMNRLFSDRKTKRRLVLSTTDGKLKVKDFKRYWNPVHEYLLKNPLTVPVKPMRFYYKGTAFGNNTKFIIEVTGVGPDPVLVPVLKNDEGREKLAGVVLTPESLESAAALEGFLLRQQTHHPHLNNATIRVVDTDMIRRRNPMYDGKSRIEAPLVGFFLYHLFAPIKLIYDRATARRQAKQNSLAPTESEDET